MASFDIQDQARRVVAPLAERADLLDPADRTILATVDAVVLARIDGEGATAELIDDRQDVRLEPGLVVGPGVQGDRFVAVSAQAPVADVVQPRRFLGQDDPLDGQRVERQLQVERLLHLALGRAGPGLVIDDPEAGAAGGRDEVDAIDLPLEPDGPCALADRQTGERGRVLRAVAEHDLEPMRPGGGGGVERLKRLVLSAGAAESRGGPYRPRNPSSARPASRPE